MKTKIEQIIIEAAKKAYEKGLLKSDNFPKAEVMETKAEEHGDFSTNFAMISAKIQKMPPLKIASAIIENIEEENSVTEKIETAGPGFINFFIKKSAWFDVLKDIHTKGEKYGAADFGKGKRIQIEFVSSNPTGPLHVGHGRGAAVGDALARIMSFCGYDVEKEYYINDSGRQINTLGRSVFFRYMELFGKKVDFPEDCYQGDYIKDYAAKIKEEKGGLLLSINTDDAVSLCAETAATSITEDMRQVLVSFGVVFDNWYSEKTLHKSGMVKKVIEELKQKKLIYEKDGALWFKSTDFGDEKDRVVVRKDGQTTYFAADIAYHKDKIDRGFDTFIDVWGADHHGYIDRVKASVAGIGADPDRLKVILVRLVNLLRDKKQIQMSTRAGKFVTLKEVIDETGTDAARFIFLTRNADSPLDFDLEEAKKRTNENPVFYVQYVHARISSIAEKYGENIDKIDPVQKYISKIDSKEELALIKLLARYPETVKRAALSMEPHLVTYYLLDLAAGFHSYYNRQRVITDCRDTTMGRLCLISAVQKVIRSGLFLLGVSAPYKM